MTTVGATRGRSELFALGSTSCVLILGMSLVAPVLPLYTDELGVSTGAIGMIIAGFAFGQVIFAPFGAIVAARIGFRRTAVLSGLLTSVTALLAAGTDTFGPLLVLRLVQGAGTGLFTTAAMARLLDVTPKSETGHALSRYQGAMLIAVSAGPVIGGWTAEAWGLRAPFIVWGALSLVATVAASIAIPAGQVSTKGAVERSSAPWRETFRALAAHRRFRTVMVVALVIFWARQGIRNTALPLIAADEFSMSPGVIGTVMMLATLLNAAALPHAGRVIDRTGRRPVLVWGTGATAVTVLCIALVQSAWMLAVVTIAVGVASGYAAICSTAIVAEIGDRDRPVALGMQRLMAQGGQAIGSLTVAVLIDWMGFRMAAVAAAGLLVLTAVFAWTMPPDELRADRGDEDEARLRLAVADEVGGG